jgi:hypothetical protein
LPIEESEVSKTQPTGNTRVVPRAARAELRCGVTGIAVYVDGLSVGEIADVLCLGGKSKKRKRGQDVDKSPE